MVFHNSTPHANHLAVSLVQQSMSFFLCLCMLVPDLLMVYKWHNLSIDSILFFLLLSNDLPSRRDHFPLQPNAVLFQLSLMGHALPTPWLEEPADAESIIEDPMVDIRPASAPDHIPGSHSLRLTSEGVPATSFLIPDFNVCNYSVLSACSHCGSPSS